MKLFIETYYEKLLQRASFLAPDSPNILAQVSLPSPERVVRFFKLKKFTKSLYEKV